MKRFDSFGAYMFDLLFGPLKRGRQAANQFFIFFRVMGREFDDLKAAILRIREEANVVSCSEAMLPVHGQDRDMPRLVGESMDAYRTRLAMKGIISQWGGTRKGILYALKAMGYDASVVPLSAQDASRWAEFTVYLRNGTAGAIRDTSVIYRELLKVKEGSSKPAAIVIEIKVGTACLRTGCAMATISTIPIPEITDTFTFSDTLRTGGRTASVVRLPVPALQDNITLTCTGRVGMTGAVTVTIPLPEIQ